MMKRFPLLFLVLLFFGFTEFSAQTHGEFRSDYEKEVFQKIADSLEVSALEIMIALDYEAGNENEIPKQIDQLYQKLGPEKLKSKKVKKQIKTIFDDIHQRKLKKYVIDADFNQLFTKGEYNCVSATALYAQVLKRFNIDYEIRETPTHVYLTADPANEKFLIETTLPQNGAVEFDYKTQKEYVNYLKSNKLISEEEYESTSIEKLFDQYYDTTKVISDRQLAALLYYNRGVEKYNESDFFEASYFLGKAYFIYPSTNIHFMTNYALIQALAECENNKSFKAEVLAQFVNLNKPGTDFAKLGLSHFALVSNELMVVHPKLEAYEEYYRSFKAAVDSSTDLSKYESEYYNQTAYNHSVNRRYSQALRALSVSYRINPENLQVKEMIYNTAAVHMMADVEHERNLDSLNKYFEIFPFLKEDEKIIGYYNYSQMRVIREHFNYGKIKEGLKKLDAFEAEIKANGMNANLDRNYFAEMYVELANHHFRQENINGASRSLKRGLELDPTSYLLQDRYKTVARLNAEFNEQQKFFNEAAKNYEESYEEKFDKYFIACWKIDGLLTKDNKEGDYDKTFKIMSYKNDKITYIMNGKTKKGKYSLRKKSKLLYLIPDVNKDDYTMFKLVEVNSTEMILMPLNEKGRLTGEKIYLSHC